MKTTLLALIVSIAVLITSFSILVYRITEYNEKEAQFEERTSSIKTYLSNKVPE
ncbi:MAG TPA: hypothetical protein VI911_11210 [Patescibacteria group bacterium]|nr:hypothetical protein [Patescibacteria group bacterium]